METIWDAIVQAFRLIFSFNWDFYQIVLRSILVSGSAAIIGSMIGIPLGVSLAEYNFRGRKFFLTLVYAFMGLPPVVMGLFLYLLIKRNSIFGFLGMLYTIPAMILAQVLLVIPIVAGFTNASMRGIDPRLGLQAQSLGASKFQSILVKMREARIGLIAAFIAGLGRVLAEVGAVMIVGGNMKGDTQVLTTQIVQLTSMGKAGAALANGIVLILIAIFVVIFLTRAQAERGRTEIEKRVTGYPS